MGGSSSLDGGVMAQGTAGGEEGAIDPSSSVGEVDALAVVSLQMEGQVT